MRKQLVIILLFIISSCATLQPQFTGIDDLKVASKNETESIAHTYYFMGNIESIKSAEEEKHFKSFHQQLQSKSDENSTLVILGNSFSKSQIQQKDTVQAEKIVQLFKGFKGESVFVNGDLEWSSGYEEVNDWSKYLNTILQNKKAVLPRNVCGIDKLKINESTILIVVDSQWFMEDWNSQPNINEDCDIKTRLDFIEELRGEINKNQDKVVILAMHHPVLSEGNHAGKYSFKDHLYPFDNKIPLPIVGSMINYTRALSGYNPQDIQSKTYTEFINHIQTIAKMYDNLIVVSAHENNLQFIESDGVKQVISGAAGSLTPARAIGDKAFTIGKLGYSTIEVMKDKSAFVNFYTYENNAYTLSFRNKIMDATSVEEVVFNLDEKALEQTNVYPKEWTEKSGFYKFLWGKHYRSAYSKLINAKRVDLDTLYGGLTPLISGGGHQSLSLRLEDKEGKQFVMRGIRKSVPRFLQTAVFKDNYVMESFNDTWVEQFIYDFYTTSHPYTSLVMSDLSKSIGMYHTTPQLFYVPKQNKLGRFNDSFGDELYIIEERPTEGFGESDNFGNTDVIISTTDMIANLRKDEKYIVDEKAYLKARIFDLLIGDWDRHGDQWRWSEFVEADKVIYRPIPRDRDQAFAKIDGNLLSVIVMMPILRHMQNYTPKFANPRWINNTAFPLDQYLLKSLSKKEWSLLANEVASQLTDEVIEQAFTKVPEELQDEDIEYIKSTLKARRNTISNYLPRYYDELKKYVVLSGTDKKDFFEIERLKEGTVAIKQFRNKKTGQELIFENTYSSNQTKEIWLYGLNDDDEFVVKGEDKTKIKIRIIGGKNEDTYDIKDGHKVYVYDYKNKKNNVLSSDNKTRYFFTNQYDLNNFNYKKLPINIGMIMPNIGYTPEDGFKVGFAYSLKQYKFDQNPFSSSHTFKGGYASATNGLSVEYLGQFPSQRNKWQFDIGAVFTSPNFAVNFYGIGNETTYFDKEMGKEYKRVLIESYSVAPALVYNATNGGKFTVGAEYKTMKVKDQANRFVTDDQEINKAVFDFQQYATLSASYGYERYNTKAYPTKGMSVNATLGWRTNLENNKENYPFLNAQLGFAQYLEEGERLVFATNFTYQTRLNTNFKFYHGATIGGNDNLRGFRPERFTGQTSFVQSSDLRYYIGNFKSKLVPFTYGVNVGFDYGRVWAPLDSSNKWHNSYGGGFWLNAMDLTSLNASYFMSEDGGRLVFGLGFGF